MRLFDFDIFVSIGDTENHYHNSSKKDWESTFHATIKHRLAMILGREPKIYRNENPLDEAGQLDPNSKQALLNSKTFICILSPDYLNSERAMKEVQEFHLATRETKAETHTTPIPRIFKVRKLPLPISQHPEEIRNLIGYQFFRNNPITQEPEELGQAHGRESELAFFATLNDLAYDINKSLQAIEKESLLQEQMKTAADAEKTGPAAVINRKIAFLADASEDLNTERETMKRGLIDKGFTVLPDKPFSSQGNEIEEQVKSFLERSDFSIHLIGDFYGSVPDAASESIIEIQNRVAAEASRQHNLKRMIWIRPDLETEDERQEEFIERIQTDPAHYFGAEIFETTLEAFKSAMSKKFITPILHKPANSGNGAPSSSDSDLIFLVCIQEDLEEVTAMGDHLRNQGLQVQVSNFEGMDSEVKKAHRQNLIECDAVILYYGKSKDLWINAKLRELKKIPGYGRKKPLLHKAVYIPGPNSETKLVPISDAMIIHGSDDFRIEDLNSFTSPLKNG